MNKDWLLLILLGGLLLVGMILTLLSDNHGGRHGYGSRLQMRESPPSFPA